MPDDSALTPVTDAPPAEAARTAPAAVGGVQLPSWMPELHPASLMALVGIDAMWGMAEMALVSSGIVEFMSVFGAPVAVAQAVVTMGGMVLAGVITGTLITLNQQRQSGDDRDTALLKGAVLGAIAAVPTPILGGTISLSYLARAAFMRAIGAGEPTQVAGQLEAPQAPALPGPVEDDAIDVEMEEVGPKP